MANPNGTTFSDTALAGSTSYSYRVRATDAAGKFRVIRYSTALVIFRDRQRNRPATYARRSSSQIKFRGRLHGQRRRHRLPDRKCQGAGLLGIRAIAAATQRLSMTPADCLHFLSYRCAHRRRPQPHTFSLTATTSTMAAPVPLHPAHNKPDDDRCFGTQINLSWTASTDRRRGVTLSSGTLQEQDCRISRKSCT